MATALSSSGVAARRPVPRRQPPQARRPVPAVAAVAGPDAPPVAPAPASIQPVVPRAELSEGIASFYDESSGLWESMW